MALMPLIQPPIMRLMTTKEERRIRMPYTSRSISRTTRLLFPIVTILICGLLVPMATPLIGMLMFGNLMRESGVVDRLTKGAQNKLTSIVTILLGLAIGSTMVAQSFLNQRTLMAMGMAAFALDAAAGLVLGKIIAACPIKGSILSPAPRHICIPDVCQSGAEDGKRGRPNKLHPYASYEFKHSRPDSLRYGWRSDTGVVGHLRQVLGEN